MILESPALSAGPIWTVAISLTLMGTSLRTVTTALPITLGSGFWTGNSISTRWALKSMKPPPRSASAERTASPRSVSVRP